MYASCLMVSIKKLLCICRRLRSRLPLDLRFAQSGVNERKRPLPLPFENPLLALLLRLRLRGDFENDPAYGLRGAECETLRDGVRFLRRDGLRFLRARPMERLLPRCRGKLEERLDERLRLRRPPPRPLRFGRDDDCDRLRLLRDRLRRGDERDRDRLSLRRDSLIEPHDKKQTRRTLKGFLTFGLPLRSTEK